MNPDIKNIIFDLGGVVLHIDYNKTAEAFQKLGLEDFSAIYSQAQQTNIFDDYEKGISSTPYFVNAILDYLPAGTTANQAVAAWNAMILDFPEENLELLLDLKAKYRTFLLSNTNDIHVQAFNRALQRVSPEKSLDPFFEKVYFSCDMKMRKPDAEIFEKVCSDNGLVKQETLFIDDTERHINSARSIGLQTHFLTNGEKLADIFR